MRGAAGLKYTVLLSSRFSAHRSTRNKSIECYSQIHVTEVLYTLDALVVTIDTKDLVKAIVECGDQTITLVSWRRPHLHLHLWPRSPS